MCRYIEYPYSLYLLVLTVRDVSNTGTKIHLLDYKFMHSLILLITFLTKVLSSWFIHKGMSSIIFFATYSKVWHSPPRSYLNFWWTIKGVGFLSYWLSLDLCDLLFFSHMNINALRVWSVFGNPLQLWFGFAPIVKDN